MMNTTMDRADLDRKPYREVIGELNELMTEIRLRNLVFSTWYGQLTIEEMSEHEWENRGSDYKPYPNSYDDGFNPWFKYWEICQLYYHSGVVVNQGRCLDMGGASSIFSYYLADKGNDVETIDLKPELVNNGNRTAKGMDWKLSNHTMDMVNIDQYEADSFDYVFSVCVMEHLNREKRINTVSKVKRILAPRGVFAITFDYLNPKTMVDLNAPSDVYKYFIEPSGLTLYGNPFKDNGKRYLTYLGKTYTFGSLFLRKG